MKDIGWQFLYQKHTGAAFKNLGEKCGETKGGSQENGYSDVNANEQLQ